MVNEKSNQLNTVIFDMDGLLIDSELFWRKAEMEVFKKVGLNLTDSDCNLTTGFRFDEVIDYWYRISPWVGRTKQAILDDVLDLMEHYIHTEIVPMKGALDCIDFCKSKGYKTAIASSSATRLIDACVKSLGIKDKMNLTLSAEKAAYGKPHPAVFLDAAAQLGAAPHQCVVLEDSVFGMIAAKAANMKCIVVPLAENVGNPKYVLADKVCVDLHDAIAYL
jgi:HAD superfamily hydrolase (TIGR01509 family)